MKQLFDVVVILAVLGANAMARPTITVEPAGTDGRPGLVVVETEYYRIAFDRVKQGSAETAMHKKWGVDIRSEDYYGTHLPLFHPLIIQAEPDPITGLTRRMKREQSRKSLVYAEHKVVKHTDTELVLEFTWQTKGDGPDWMDKLIRRKRLYFRDNSPVIKVEFEVENTDDTEHPVIAYFWNSASQGHIGVRTTALATDELVQGWDTANEGSSSHILLPNIAGQFIGGVSGKETGVGYSYDWPDVDAMQMSNFKTVGSTYLVAMRRRTIKPGEKIVYPCTFMTWNGLPILEGMVNDLAGGMKIEQKKDEPSPLSVSLVSGSPREVAVTVTCKRLEDDAILLEEKKALTLGIDEVQNITTAVSLVDPGMYVLTVMADDDAGTKLSMERGIEVGISKKSWQPTPPPGEKRGLADASQTMYPARMHKQFRTIDRAFSTPHIPFLANHAKGTVKAYFMTVANPTLSHVREIVQRGDFEYDYKAVEMMAAPKGALNEQALVEFSKEYKAYDPDVLFLLGVDVDNGLREKHFGPILKLVNAGMGLVLQTAAPGKGSLLGKRIPEWTRLERVGVSSIATPKTRLTGAQYYTYGKGRIVYYPTKLRYYRDEGEMLIGGWTNLGGNEISEDGWRGFEYAYANLTDGLRWAAKKESPVTVVKAELVGLETRVTVNNAGEARKATVAVQERSRLWEARGRAELSVDLPVGASTHFLKLDRAPLSGPLALEVTVRDAATQKTLAFGSAAAEGGPTRISVTCEPLARMRAAPGQVSVALKNQPGAGTLRLIVRDRFGRVVQVSDAKVSDDTPFSTEFTLDGSRVVDIYHELVPEFIPEGREEVVAQGFGRAALMPETMPYEYRYVGAVAGGPERKTKHIQGMLEACRRGHLEMHTHCMDFAQMYRSGGYSSGYVFTGAKSYKLDKDGAMQPPLVQSEETLAKRRDGWQNRARRYLENGVRALLLDDERRFSGEWDYSEPTLNAFRKHLQERYKDIAALNRSWGTSFESFEKVMPKTLAELDEGESENRAQWLEHRMFCGETLAQNHLKLPYDWAKEIDPRLSVGEMGIYSPSSLYPVDWARYAKYYENTQHYAMADEFRSFAPNSNCGKWTGYGWVGFKEQQRPVVWENLFNGGNWVYFWEMRSAGNIWYAVVTSDLRLTEPYQKICHEELPDIMGGLDQMIIASTDQDQGVAVAYSYPSLMLGGSKGHLSSGIAGASCNIMKSLGYTYRFIDLKSEHMPQLAEEPYKLFLAQHLSCLSKEQAQHIEAFAAAGNPVLIVGRTGWLNTVGSVHAGGALGDRLCGIDTSETTAISKPVATEWNGTPINLIVERSGVKVTDAEVLAKGLVDGVEIPVLTVRAVGKGNIYYLNSTLAGQAKTFTGGVAGEESVTVAGPEDIRKSHFAIYTSLLTEAGLVQGATVQKDGKQVESDEVWTYRSPSGRSRYVALCPHQDKRNPEPVDAEIRFAGEAAHIYNMRTQKYLGFGSSVTDSCALFRFKTYALLPYTVTGLAAAADQTAVAAGDTIALTFTVKADTGEADLHGIRVSVTGPDGNALDAYKTVLLARKGVVQHALPIALNEAPGVYTVKAVDCVSGLAGEVEVSVSDTSMAWK